MADLVVMQCSNPIFMLIESWEAKKKFRVANILGNNC